MASLDDVYGNNYQTESQRSRVDHIVNTMTNNIAHRQFRTRLHDTSELWKENQSLSPEAIDAIISKVEKQNKSFRMLHLKKGTAQTNMLPELIIDTPVEYFVIIDNEMKRAYFIYITPTETNSY